MVFHNRRELGGAIFRPFVPTGVGSTVQFDQSSFTVVTSGVTSPITLSGLINVGAGSNGTSDRALIFAVCFPNSVNGLISGVSVTWHGQSMSSIISQNTTVSDTYVFGLVAPDTGSNNFVLTFTGVTTRLDVSVLSVVGANQTGGSTTFANATSKIDTGSPSNITVNSATGDICFATHTVSTDFTTPSGTDIGKDNLATIGANASNWDVGASTVTLTYTNGGGNWKSLGCDIVHV